MKNKVLTTEGKKVLDSLSAKQKARIKKQVSERLQGVPFTPREKILQAEKDSQKATKYFHSLLNEFSGKLDMDHIDEIIVDEIELDCHRPSSCEVDTEEGLVQIAIEGAVQLVGEARFPETNRKEKVYSRFIGKTFWQYCHRSS